MSSGPASTLLARAPRSSLSLVVHAVERSVSAEPARQRALLRVLCTTMSKKKNDDNLHIVCNSDDKRAWIKAAEKDYRSTAEWVRVKLNEASG